MFNLAPSRDAFARSGHNLAPGIGLALTIAAAASFLAEHCGGPVMLFALLVGMTFNFLATEGRCAGGIAFTSRTVLRIDVSLLGVRVIVFLGRVDGNDQDERGVAGDLEHDEALSRRCCVGSEQQLRALSGRVQRGMRATASRHFLPVGHRGSTVVMQTKRT